MSVKGLLTAGVLVAALVGVGQLDASLSAAVPTHGMGEAAAGCVAHCSRGDQAVTWEPAPQPTSSSSSSSSHHRLLRAYVAWRVARFGFRHLVLGRRFHVTPWWMR